MRGRPEADLARDLPDHVAGPCVSAQHDGRAAGQGEVLRYLEDPYVVAAAFERDVRRDGDVGAPTVDAGREREPAQISGAEFGDRGGSSRGIGVGGLHVADGGRESGWALDVAGRGSRIVDREDLARDFGA